METLDVGATAAVNRLMISMGPISTVTVYCCSCSAVSWLSYVVFVGDSSQILPLIFIFFLDCCNTNLLLKEFPRKTPANA